ncbi:hypothetical protein [Streptomyces ossamyceticus]|uniref:hypothetical protein n=1 Tax=Streptomyces ossamyceticus TaxID=249581 RepID=UPI003424A41C
MPQRRTPKTRARRAAVADAAAGLWAEQADPPHTAEEDLTGLLVRAYVLPEDERTRRLAAAARRTR